jgi:hypothetical protein
VSRNPVPVYELHHLEYGNIGDREAAPLRYFASLLPDWIEVRKMSYHSPEVLELENDTVVLGGGGILNPFDWWWVVLPLLERGNRVIAFGVGHHHDHHHFDPAEIGDWRASVEHYGTQYPLGQLWLAGVRDVGTPFEHVPDASCLSSAFDRSRRVEHPVVLYEQGDLDPIAIEGPPRSSNKGERELDQVADFLGSGEVVITNSYHGAYWALLLGRRVLVYEPWCSKWLLTPWDPVFCDRENWGRRLSDARAVPGLLERSRKAVSSFGEGAVAALRSDARRRSPLWLRPFRRG